MTDFDAIVPAIAEALRKRGYETLTPVQQAMIDPDLEGRDALVSAQTGSGKTVAFGLAMAPTIIPESGRFDRAGTPLALAIAPTRELAMQVKRELEWLYAETGAIIGSCVGGMDIRNERPAQVRLGGERTGPSSPSPYRAFCSPPPRLSGRRRVGTAPTYPQSAGAALWPASSITFERPLHD